MTATTTQQKGNKRVNRVLYLSFVALSAYFLFFSRDMGTAMSNLGIALVFDPFDPGVAWKNRPSWQRVVLVLHLVVVFILLGMMLSTKF
ncbi:MAG: hypothetical protein GC171_11035 [Terrimonas sp.]|nr:hypothetical protein [Terrimonas sp.]